MLSIYLEAGTQGTTSTAKDATIVALHVLTRALFGGKSHAFTNELEIQVQDGRTMSYRDTLGVILKNVVHAVAMPHRLLSLPFLPKRFRVLGQAIQAFNTYVTEMITKEQVLISKRDPGANSMISSLVRASEEAQDDPGDGPGRRGLADNEILGNVFIYSFAGHETTANAMAYCILLTAAYPEYQEWLSEEINHVLGDRDDVETWEYEEVFPKLKRCVATMARHPSSKSFQREC
jgi:cytochrome P450